MARPLCAGCSSRPAEVGESKLCTVCLGWKREVDDLAAVNAHHVDERNHAQEILQAVRDYANEMGDANRVRLRLLDIIGDDTTEERKRIGFRESTEPKHLPSLGPEPTTVAEWVKMTEETGILEFPLLLEIAGKLEAKLADQVLKCEICRRGGF